MKQFPNRQKWISINKTNLNQTSTPNKKERSLLWRFHINNNIKEWSFSFFKQVDLSFQLPKGANFIYTSFIQTKHRKKDHNFLISRLGIHYAISETWFLLLCNDNIWSFGKQSLPFLEEFPLMLPKHAVLPAFSVLELAVFELSVTVITVAIAVTVMMMTIVSMVRHMVSTSCCSHSTRYNCSYASMVMSCIINLVFSYQH